ncbi:MAG: SulP family inorganic anion transporter [Inconstantimicrobium porci]|uniref:SulP family inorganic anion transporter n=1 Tax=Inconstantimicrobium porci TaxID=2652291 RepID=UPI002A90B750|nr:SulP family inorganic anion transporter [Inconstantimicrobium porci]MDY5911442.1 SulP family inorganic anion transporter [Inconstantimicrobium porci]
MKFLFPTLKDYKLQNLRNDIFSGVIIAFVSIPIAMGYAQISGLPAIYGLYGSILPVLVFAMISSSKQFVFGVDAAPAALVGSFLATTGIPFESDGAAALVFLMTVLTALWLFIFAVLKVGNLVEYISSPVMGGFITGIAFTVILMQIPKLMGSKAVTGELFELLVYIERAFEKVNVYALVLGLVTLAVLLVSKKFLPKFPMVIVVMILSAVIQSVFHLDKLGIKMLPGVSLTIPNIDLSLLHVNHVKDVVLTSLAVAAVIMAQTLLAENNNAMRNEFKIDNNRELYAFSCANLVSALCGGCPLNGSVSRTSLCEQYGGRSQMMSVSAAATMMLVVLFGSKFIAYLPVPVLTAIVIYALIGVLKIDLAKKLFKVNKKEFYIFMCAFFGVLIFGTIYGVVIGIILSFTNVVIRESNPVRTFLGVVPGMKGFYSLDSNSNARPIKNTVIYRFGGNLFFANIKLFQEDIENSIKEDTKCVIVDGRGIGSIDVTAAERIEIIYKSLKNRGIKLYLTEHMSELNEQMRDFGIGYIIEEGSARSTIVSALASQGMITEYLLEEHKVKPVIPKIKDHIYSELEWAFGEEGAHEHFERYTKEIIEHLSHSDDKFCVESLYKNISSWNNFGNFDEVELIENLELHIDEIAERIKKDRALIAVDLENRKKEIIDFIQQNNPKAYEKILAHKRAVDKILKEKYPDIYTKLIEEKNKKVH